ncbi:MAG TPA: hypothetical protein VFS87_07545, partial [Qipengyuania sp.]|nr:hypothetical protein [Qipengyuania sp.]
MGSAKNIDDCAQLRENLIAALTRLRGGDFSVRLALDSREPRDQEIAALFNEVVGLNESITGEFNRVARVVGKEGDITNRAKVKGAAGGWQVKLNAVNELINDMVQPTTEVARVI